MSNAIVDLTVSLVDHRDVSIDPYAGNSVDVASRGGHYYSGLAPGTSYLLVPSYLLAKPLIDALSSPALEQRVQGQFHPMTGHADWAPSKDRLRVILASIAGCWLGTALISGWLASALFLLLRRWYPFASETRLTATAAGAILCTNFFYYSASIDHRVFAGAMLITALLIAEQDPRWFTGLAFGACLGIATATSYESVFIVPMLLAWWFKRLRTAHLMLVIAGLGAPILLLLLYQYRCFGSPWATPYAYRLSFEIFHTSGWNSAFPLSFGQALREAPRFIVNFLFGSKLGLFVYSPMLLLNFLLFFRRWRGALDPKIVMLSVASAAIIVGFHLLTGYRGGPGDFGPRYLMLAIPFLVLLLPAVRVHGAVFGLAWVGGLIVSLRGVMYGLLHEPFWYGYTALLREHGLSSYALLKLKAVDDHAPGRWASSALVGSVLIGALGLLFTGALQRSTAGVSGIPHPLKSGHQ